MQVQQRCLAQHCLGLLTQFGGCLWFWNKTVSIRQIYNTASSLLHMI